jgi:hypothetical protein
MTAVSPRGDGIGDDIEADGRLSRQSKNYQNNYKTKHPCKAYMSWRHEVLPSDAQIPQVVNTVVWAGVDRHECMGAGMLRVHNPTGNFKRYSSRGIAVSAMSVS